MPALYRMPVFYLLILVVGLAVGLNHVLSPRVEPDPSLTIPVEETPQPIRVATEADDRPPPDGILRTADGLRRKVVVKDLAVVCRDDPGASRANGPSLDYFAIRYLYGEQPNWCQVGPMGGPPEGWVPAGSIVEWDTRLMARRRLGRDGPRW